MFPFTMPHDSCAVNTSCMVPLYRVPYPKGVAALDIFEVRISKDAQKDLTKVPQFIVTKLTFWIDSISESGLREVKKIPGFHDEPLKGKRSGQRSIRLSKAYRAIYKIVSNGSIEVIDILEVNKHEY